MSDQKDLKATARASFEALVEAAGGDGRKLVGLAALAARIDLNARVYPLALRARECAPGDREIRTRARFLIGKSVPKFHDRMLRDSARNAAFDAAIRRAVTPGAHVLDIGAGSGLLSMMAARAGAGRVVACEENPAIADVARRIVATNGYAEKITVVTGNSQKLDVEADLTGKADVVVSEIVSNNLLAEGVLKTLADAAQRLLAPGGQMIPASGDVMVALATWPAGEHSVGTVEGFDLAEFDTLARISRAVGVGDPTLTLRSESAPALSFDFAARTSRDTHRGALTLIATGDGPIAGVVQWIRLQLDAETCYENRPSPTARSHWSAHFHPFAAPLGVPAGTPVRIAVMHDGTDLLLWQDETTVPTSPV